MGRPREPAAEIRRRSRLGPLTAHPQRYFRPHIAARTQVELSLFHVKNREMEPLLLVEDKNELRAMLRKALERNGYAVDEAPDGSAAIQKLRGRRYQLVLTNLKMPGA